MNQKNNAPDTLCDRENYAYDQKIYTQTEKPVVESTHSNFIKTHRKTQSSSINAPFVGNKPTHTRQHSNGFGNFTMQAIKENVPKKGNQTTFREKNKSTQNDEYRRKQQNHHSSNLQSQSIQNLKGYNLQIRRRLNYELKKNNQLIKACQALAEQNQIQREKNRKMKAKRQLVEQNKSLRKKLQAYEMLPIGVINKMKQLQEENNKLKNELMNVKNREYHERTQKKGY